MKTRPHKNLAQCVHSKSVPKSPKGKQSRARGLMNKKTRCDRTVPRTHSQPLTGTWVNLQYLTLGERWHLQNHLGCAMNMSY